MAELAAVSELMVGAETEHEIKLSSGKVWKVWLKQPTWFDRQYALSGWVDIDSKTREAKTNFVEYYKRLTERCLIRSDPPIDKKDLSNLRPEIGVAIEQLLPAPVDIGFTPEEEKKS